MDKQLSPPAEQSIAPPQPAPASSSAHDFPTAKPVSTEQASLLQQRLDATHNALSAPNRGNVSIQLFYTDDIRPERMERFLGRAKRLGKLSEIFIVPIKLNGKDGYRVLYGLYADDSAARAGMQGLPQRYKDAFAPALHMLDGSQNPP